MLSLTHKHVLLGVSGGIAAYKSAELIRRLQDAGASVRVIMTRGAQEFITPLTLQALSGNPVHTELLDPQAEAGMGHIELARWADILVIAPATAEVIAKLAQGHGSDLLTTVALATTAPLALAPAMNQAMWAHSATQDNLSALVARGAQVFGPASGGQACGDVGLGRMSEPADLATAIAGCFSTGALAGLKVTLTAGPTREAIDPVRYISNHSSGKMGYALAEACAEAGAQVTLVSGPTQLAAPAHVNRVSVNSAEEMLAAVQAVSCDIFIGAAAVADYRPKAAARQKLKKQGSEPDEMTLQLVRNPDIIATVASQPHAPFCVGFAAETENLLAYARAKLNKKNLQLVIANDVSRTDIGFNSDDNAVTLVSAEGDEVLGTRAKRQLARDLVALIAERVTRYRQSQA
ncbi:bifunctional phosphopantothenoylcysteine decarboxylase/phosphopantothenate--cysteine ligase CoaBC [Simiduia sp. 21SJ11W-1]|uniref:bifunctional phosphopantothenoylcysteine decarboxylase/phosphopantothenate--cysteine ligase CoaBC n=1 Tax=Simiduia sp. 21SJ11W-1 TaxID=2909669 RepID=UPI00209EA176|nr:bifunctional phosphopantothenoylcysteine decarboxylase/phosphopantothenate--cysteine ligase CoaBC [Simiduia sp. 21SJ11W-1]UTA47997.1 bifunctional phosphopantothenoylcysteine decarboxylase/phosphopantothenate--cysteine ligase CoaBC [Simiduia sp. 21SJ11W-1]